MVVVSVVVVVAVLVVIVTEKCDIPGGAGAEQPPCLSACLPGLACSSFASSVPLSFPPSPPLFAAWHSGLLARQQHKQMHMKQQQQKQQQTAAKEEHHAQQ